MRFYFTGRGISWSWNVSIFILICYR